MLKVPDWGAIKEGGWALNKSLKQLDRAFKLLLDHQA